MKNMLNYHQFLDDGLFWMEWSDFLDEFECFYVCRMFGKDSGWQSVSIEDKWTGEYA